jgi:hypothetical protein
VVILPAQLHDLFLAEFQFCLADDRQLLLDVQQSCRDAVHIARADQHPQLVGQIADERLDKVDDLGIGGDQMVVVQHDDAEILQGFFQLVDQPVGQFIGRR